MKKVKAKYPRVPLTLYANGMAGILERMGTTGVDVVGLDWSVDMADARKRLGNKVAVQVGIGRGGGRYAEERGKEARARSACLLACLLVRGRCPPGPLP